MKADMARKKKKMSSMKRTASNESRLAVSFLPYFYTTRKLRVMWYLHMIALKDEETQRKGAVAVIYNVTPNANAFVALLDKDFFKRLGRVKEALPFRSACIHYCFSDPAFGFVIKCVTLALERNARTRTRLHRGT